MHKGLLMKQFNKYEEAKKLFLRCIKIGEVYDARITRECGLQLQNILYKVEQKPKNKQLEAFMDTFKHKNSDFVFLVNESPVENDNGAKMIE